MIINDVHDGDCERNEMVIVSRNLSNGDVIVTSIYPARYVPIEDEYGQVIHVFMPIDGGEFVIDSLAAPRDSSLSPAAETSDWANRLQKILNKQSRIGYTIAVVFYRPGHDYVLSNPLKLAQRR